MMKYDNEGAVYNREIYPVQSLPSDKNQYFISCGQVVNDDKAGAVCTLRIL